MHSIILPELGEGIEKAKIACWHTSVGQLVAIGDDIVEVVTDKASFNVPSGISGRIKEICVDEGQEIKIGEVLAVLEP